MACCGYLSDILFAVKWIFKERKLFKLIKSEVYPRYMKLITR